MITDKYIIPIPARKNLGPYENSSLDFFGGRRWELNRVA